VLIFVTGAVCTDSAIISIEVSMNSEAFSCGILCSLFIFSFLFCHHAAFCVENGDNFDP